MSTLVGEGFGGEKGSAPRFGVLQTLWRICTRPVSTVTEYLAGKTRKYFNPIALLLLLSAACAFAAHFLHVALVPAQALADTPENPLAGFTRWFFSRLNENPALSLLFMAPLTALNARWIFRRVSRLGYVQYLYVEIFLGCISMTLSLLQVFVYALSGIGQNSAADQAMTGISLLVFYAVAVAVYRSLLGIRWVRAAAGTLLAAACSYAMAAILTFLLLFGFLVASLLP